jgi:hypothetical protein
MKNLSTPSAPRLDIYASVHRGLRAMMMDTLSAVGRADAHHSAELSAACERVLVLCDTCASHLEHENEFIHPVMEAHRPGSTAQVAADHEDHLAAITELCAMARALRTAHLGAEPDPQQAMTALYRKLTLFVAENFIHMHAEEVEHNPVLWATHSDEALRTLEGHIAASIPPAQHLLFLRWMVPALPPVERAALLTGLQAAAPPPVLAAVLDTVRPHLSPRDWGALNSALSQISSA